MAHKVIILYRLYMPYYFLGTFTEYPYSIFRLNVLQYIIFQKQTFSHFVKTAYYSRSTMHQYHIRITAILLNTMYNTFHQNRSLRLRFQPKISRSSLLLSLPIQLSPVATVISAKCFLCIIISLIRSSNVPFVIKRCTATFFCCPIRYARSVA